MPLEISRIIFYNATINNSNRKVFAGSGRERRTRTVAVPFWVRCLLDAQLEPAVFSPATYFAPVRKGDKMSFLNGTNMYECR
jgi:hypothetical protein